MPWIKLYSSPDEMRSDDEEESETRRASRNITTDWRSWTITGMTEGERERVDASFTGSSSCASAGVPALTLTLSAGSLSPILFHPERPAVRISPSSSPSSEHIRLSSSPSSPPVLCLVTLLVHCFYLHSPRHRYTVFAAEIGSRDSAADSELMVMSVCPASDARRLHVMRKWGADV